MFNWKSNKSALLPLLLDWFLDVFYVCRYISGTVFHFSWMIPAFPVGTAHASLGYKLVYIMAMIHPWRTSCVSEKQNKNLPFITLYNLIKYSLIINNILSRLVNYNHICLSLQDFHQRVWLANVIMHKSNFYTLLLTQCDGSSSELCKLRLTKRLFLLGQWYWLLTLHTSFVEFYWLINLQAQAEEKDATVYRREHEPPVKGIQLLPSWDIRGRFILARTRQGLIPCTVGEFPIPRRLLQCRLVQLQGLALQIRQDHRSLWMTASSRTSWRRA